MNRVIFLDIDGPIISTSSFYLDPYCSMTRSAMNTNAIGFVNALCDGMEAKVVFNSTHNEQSLGVSPQPLHMDMIKHGLDRKALHACCYTKFPYPPAAENVLVQVHARQRAIDLWLKENDPDADWIAFDDEHFTIDKRLILVDFHKGIDYDAYRSAVARFNPKSPMKDLAEW